MMISEIRRRNARALASMAGGQAELARRASMSDSQVSQLLGDNPSKNIGNLIARRIEAVFDLPGGWLDSLRTDEDIKAALPDTVRPETIINPPQSPPVFYIDPEEIALINGYRQSTATGKLSIRAAVEAAEKLSK